jgi:hypothetical protein
VDNQNIDNAPGRPQAVPEDAGHSQKPNPGTQPATRPTELTPTAAGFRIRHCAWCKGIDIRGPRRDTDVISLLVIGKRILAAWNGKVMIVQDGICEICAGLLKDGKSPVLTGAPEQSSDKSTTL